MALPIARDLMNEGIRVNTILPGVFKTPMVAMMPPNVQDALGAQVPFPKAARPGRGICAARLLHDREPLHECGRGSARWRDPHGAALMIEYPRLLDDIAEAAREAGEAILEIVQRGFDVEAKRDSSPVTEADRAAELIILAALARAAPGVPVIAEEEVAGRANPGARRYLFPRRSPRWHEGVRSRRGRLHGEYRSD